MSSNARVVKPRSTPVGPQTGGVMDIYPTSIRGSGELVGVMRVKCEGLSSGAVVEKLREISAELGGVIAPSGDVVVAGLSLNPPSELMTTTVALPQNKIVHAISLLRQACSYRLAKASCWLYSSKLLSHEDATVEVTLSQGDLVVAVVV